MYEDHLHHLNVVFEKFQKAGLKIKLSKCQFFKSDLHYLGHRISANGLELLSKKLKAIKNLAPARNVGEACHILKLLGYYRSFIPTFADNTLPINNLLKKNTPFIWSFKCQQVLDYLKEIFCNKPHLQFPDPNKPYILLQLHPTMCTLVFFAKPLIVTKILGQLLIFQTPSQHKTGVGAQLKKKHML